MTSKPSRRKAAVISSGCSDTRHKRPTMPTNQHGCPTISSWLHPQLRRRHELGWALRALRRRWRSSISGAARAGCRRGKPERNRADQRWPEALFLIYSASKPCVALLVHLLAQRGMLSLDDSVAAYWPEHGQRGKRAIIVRHVLQHRAGVPVAGSLLRTVLHMSNWDLSVRDAEQTRPRWAAGQVAAYHFITYGFILGELVRRVTGVPVRDFLRSELLAPLGLDAVWLGLPDELWSRRVRVRAGHPSEWINQVVFNRRKIRQAVIPAAGISATARQLARLYKMLLMGGELDGVRLLEERTIAEARQPSSDSEVDAFINGPSGGHRASFLLDAAPTT